MLDTHPEAAQSMVIGAFILCQGTCLGFLVRDIDAGVIILKPLITTVGVDMGRRWQWRPAPADFKIMNPARRVRRPVIKEIEKEVVRTVEVVKEVPVDKVVFKEVAKEIVRKELVYVPMFTDDPDLLRERMAAPKGGDGAADGETSED